MTETAAIVLAAGRSTRMRSDLPKVLHELCGRPMLAYVLEACRLAGADRLIVVVGHGKQQVQAQFAACENIEWVEQPEQKGTAHAVLCCRELFTGSLGSLLVVAGDMPLVRRETLATLLERRRQHGDSAVLATAVLDDPAGYGRIVRDENGAFLEIVEEADCTPQQRGITEVNPSYYCFDPARLFAVLNRTPPRGAKGEHYLTDAVGLLRAGRHSVFADISVSPEEATGVNSRLDLAVAGRTMQDRIQLALMNDGVTIVDPDNTWIEADASIGSDTILFPFTMIRSGARIGANCRIGPFANVEPGECVGDGAAVAGIGLHAPAQQEPPRDSTK